MKDWTMFVLLAATLASLILFIYAKRKERMFAMPSYPPR